MHVRSIFYLCSCNYRNQCQHSFLTKASAKAEACFLITSNILVRLKPVVRTLRTINLLVRGEAIALNKILVSAGATLSALGLIAAAPADASTLSFDFQLETSTNVELSPLLAGQTFAGMTLPDSIAVTTDEVTGSFITLDNLEQVTDGDIELNYDFISHTLNDSYVATLESVLTGFGLTVEQTLQSVDDLFTITQFDGGGILTSESIDLADDPNNPSPFDISYDSETNAVVIDGYSNEVATSCFRADCDVTATVSYGVGLVINEFVTFTDDLLANPNINLSDETADAIRDLQRSVSFIQFLIPSLEAINLATVTSTVSADTEFVAANPEGSADDVSVDLTSGALTVTATTDGQQEELFSIQYPEEPESTVAENRPAVEPATAQPVVTVMPTAPSPIIASVSATETNNAQDVPEPSIILGFLGTAAWMAKRSRKQTADR